MSSDPNFSSHLLCLVAIAIGTPVNCTEALLLLAYMWRCTHSGHVPMLTLCLLRLCFNVFAFPIFLFRLQDPSYATNERGKALYQSKLGIWLSNAFYCAVGYATLSICVDRYCALYHPFRYNLFIKLKVRLAVITGYCLFCLGMAYEYYYFNGYSTNCTNSSGSGEDCIYQVRYSTFYHGLTSRTAVVLLGALEYVFPTIAMCYFCARNVQRLRTLCVTYAHLLPKRKKYWLECQKNMVRLSIICTQIYAITYAPAIVMDIVVAFKSSGDESGAQRAARQAFDVLQVAGVQVHFLVFLASSYHYRHAFVNLWIVVKFLSQYPFQKNQSTVWKSSQTSVSVVTSNLQHPLHGRRTAKPACGGWPCRCSKYHAITIHRASVSTCEDDFRFEIACNGVRVVKSAHCLPRRHSV